MGAASSRDLHYRVKAIRGWKPLPPLNWHIKILRNADARLHLSVPVFAGMTSPLTSGHLPSLTKEITKVNIIRQDLIVPCHYAIK